MASEWILSLLTLTSSSLSFFLKLPQIISIVKSKSVEGINRISLMIEIWNFFTSVSYAAHFGYPVKLYAEYSGLILQSLVIFMLVFTYSKGHQRNQIPSNSFMILTLISITVLHSLVAFQFFDDWMPTAIILTSLPSSPLSRIMQIRQIIMTGSSGSLSSLTWFLASITTGCRFMSNMLTVSDGLLLFRLGSATLLNALLSLTILCYRSKNKTD